MKKLGFVFPGQGSQNVGMLKDFANEKVVKRTFEEASDTIGYDVWSLIHNGTKTQINQTQTTQPIILCCSIALWRLWSAQGGPAPSYLAGHSLGEWSALVCSGSVSFSDALSIVETRGALMQAAVPEGKGAMAAIIGLEFDRVIMCCQEAQQDDEVTAANFNAPRQVVIAGSSEGVARAMCLCKDAGAKRAVVLPVSAPFHTAMMYPAALGLKKYLESIRFSKPCIPIVHNVNAKLESDPPRIRALMLDQIYKPVLWVDCIEQLSAFGVDRLVECGPGSILSGLSKRINRNIKSFSIEKMDDFKSAMSTLSQKE